MNRMKRIVVAAVIALSATGLYAGCLSDFNQAMYGCDSTNYGFFTRQGCRVDALNSYYGCILDMATG